MKKNKPVHRNIRFPRRLDDMVVDIQTLGECGSFTEALVCILTDWEKTRFLEEKRRLIDLARIKFAVVNNELKRTT